MVDLSERENGLWGRGEGRSCKHRICPNYRVHICDIYFSILHGCSKVCSNMLLGHVFCEMEILRAFRRWNVQTRDGDYCIELSKLLAFLRFAARSLAVCSCVLSLRCAFDSISTLAGNMSYIRTAARMGTVFKKLIPIGIGVDILYYRHFTSNCT